MVAGMPWPRRVQAFVDRVDQREFMLREVNASRAADVPCRLYVHAAEGLGRWSLVSEFFNQHHALFGETYIEVDAQDGHGRLVPPGEMMGRALVGLGREGDLPASDAERADAFQRLSVGRTFLMLIRNVSSVEQVECLLSASPGATVVVTTGANLRGLQVRHDFVPVPLGELDDAAAWELMIKRLKSTADDIDPEILQKLVALCYGHPLLIRLVAAQVIGRPHVALRIIEDGEPSGVISVDADPERIVAAISDRAYDALKPDAQRAYRLLALLPGSDFGVPVAATTLQTDHRTAARLIDRLVDANVLEPRGGSGRFAYLRRILPDAKQRAQRVDGHDECADVIHRVTAWCLAEVAPRDTALSGRWREGPAFASTAPIPNRADALDWFSNEWRTAVACVDAAAKNGQPEVAWQLCVGLYKYLHQQGLYDAWLDCHLIGLAAAESVGDIAAVMQLSSQRGAAYLAKEDFAAARADFQRSLKCAVEIGHRLGEQSANEWLGKVAAKEGRIDEAFRCYDASEAVIRRAGGEIPPGQRSRMLALLGLQRGRAELERREWAAAIRWIGGSLRYFDRQTGERENRAKCLMVLGTATAASTAADDAARSFEEAAALFARDGMRRDEAQAQLSLGDSLAGRGRLDEAADSYRQAVRLFASLGAAEEDIAQERLKSLS
ncbi:tetratricopeptide repeat protein [Kribbella solani]|uniref:tetratricopeptide repeat protein n=1 Tax=Kribbella solani TaxID=236067 RepID=UPI0029B7F278|nr:tetratricopeptide repeat protein [Kribbella solani]MDX3003463.1 tetratricopeptide repeat protein [Kribbella solani]